MDAHRARQRARQLYAAGSMAEALATLEVAADAAIGTEPATAVDLLVEAASLALHVGGPDSAVETAQRAVAAASVMTGVERQQAMIRLGDALSWAGRYDDARRAWQRASLDVPKADARMLAERANALVRLGDPGARSAAFRALVAARATQDPAQLADTLNLSVVAEVHGGNLKEALGRAEEVCSTVVPGTVDESDAFGLLAWVLALLGDETECREAIRHAVGNLDSQRVTAPGGLAMGLLALSKGDPTAAVAAFEAKLSEMRFGPVAAMTALRPFAAELVEAYARAGRLEQGRRVLAATLPVALATGQPRLIAPMRRAQGILESDEDAMRHALDAHAGWDNRFELARTRLAFGELLRRQRRRAEARDELAAAAAGFDQVGARLWHERALAELRLAGERLPARRSPTAALPETLTHQEGEVLELVRAGLSNREIAERLVLSVKTIEAHLTTIYGKLGVASRAQAISAASHPRDGPSR